MVKTGLRLAASYLATQEGTQVLAWARRVLPDLETVDDIALHASAHYLMGTAKFRNGYSMSDAAIHYAEAYEACEYGSPLTEKNKSTLFPFLTTV